jgi:hypothetical protein
MNRPRGGNRPACEALAGRRRWRKVGRLRLAATAALMSAAVAGFLSTQLPAPSSFALDSTPPSQPGSAFASAAALAINPEYGGLSLVMFGGESTASYTGSQAIADSQAVNGGLLGSSLSGGGSNACSGASSGTSSASPLDALESSSTAGGGAATADGGVESVNVTSSPELATATTSLTPVTVPGFLVLNGQTGTQAEYTAGQDQSADASTTMSLRLLGGLVAFNGLSWEAQQDIGTHATATTSFTMTSMTIAGSTTPTADPDELSSAISSANTVLSPFGLMVTLPTSSTNPVTGTIAISPLQIQLTGNEVSDTVLQQLNGSEATLEQNIAAALEGTGNACIESLAAEAGSAELVAGVLEGIMAGGGVIDLQLGGASAQTAAAPDYANPLGASAPVGGGLGQNQPESSPTSTPGSTLATTGDSGTATTTPPTTGLAPAAAAPSQPSSVNPAVLIRCVTTSPAGRPGCSSGAATIAATALLAVGSGLYAADVIRSRRKFIRPRRKG